MFWRKLLVGVFVIAFAATAANAYTIVMRSGRQVEIPNTFTVTKSTLTYETAPGIQITIQLTSVDIAATERVNNQPGSLSVNTAKRAEISAPAQVPVPKARRSITNQDLETYRKARLEGERERQELGLPSVEERRKETEEIEDRLQEQVRNRRSQEELDFWRNRTVQLEAQMAATQAQMGAMNNQVNDVPWAYPYGVGLWTTTGFPSAFDGFHGFNKFGFNNFGFNNFGFNSHFPGQFRGRLRYSFPQPRGGAPNMGRPGFHGGGRGGGGRGGGGRR